MFSTVWDLYTKFSSLHHKSDAEQEFILWAHLRKSHFWWSWLIQICGLISCPVIPVRENTLQVRLDSNQQPGRQCVRQTWINYDLLNNFGTAFQSQTRFYLFFNGPFDIWKIQFSIPLQLFYNPIVSILFETLEKLLSIAIILILI